jgi:nitroreductase/dihydropteridine reductase
MQFSEIVHARYAAKSFDGKTVPEATIDELKELIRFAPTSFNFQPWKAKIVSDEAAKAELAAAAYNQPQVTSCSHLFVFCANTDLDALADKLEAAAVAAGTPPEKVKGYMGMVRGVAAGMDDATKLGWAKRQAYLALGNGVNGAKALGLDSCPMEGFDPAAFSTILELPATLVPVVIMPVGYANDTPRPKHRFDTADLFI